MHPGLAFDYICWDDYLTVLRLWQEQSSVKTRSDI